MLTEKYYKKFLETNPYPRELKTYQFLLDESMYLIYKGKKIINFSSSDYLGLAKNPLLISRSQHYAAQYGVGTTASRLVMGNIDIFDQLENKLAQAIGKPAALIFGTGYQTNASVLDALLDPVILGDKAYVFCDYACHSSLITSSRYVSRLQRFRHNDYRHLRTLLDTFSRFPQPKFIIVESVYSMEGDKADLEQLIEIAKYYDAFLYVDDAHAMGVYGKKGFGMASEYADDIDMIMGTFSKAGGSLGGYVACSSMLRDYLINKCKNLIYSTGISPAILGAIDAAIELLPHMKNERERIQKYAVLVREGLEKLGFDNGLSNTHIISWIIGDATKAQFVSQLLLEEGILCVTIRPPSVPMHTSRIRFCLSSAHCAQDIEHLLSALKKVRVKMGYTANHNGN